MICGGDIGLPDEVKLGQGSKLCQALSPRANAMNGETKIPLFYTRPGVLFSSCL